MTVLRDIKRIENIGDLKKRQKEGLKYLSDLKCEKIFSSEEVFEIIYLCINLYYNSVNAEEKDTGTSKIFYLKSAEKFLKRYFDIKGDGNIFCNDADVLMLIELAACFSIECLYGESTELLMKVIDNTDVNRDLKKRALEELFFESEKFLPLNKVDEYKEIYSDLI